MRHEFHLRRNAPPPTYLASQFFSRFILKIMSQWRRKYAFLQCYWQPAVLSAHLLICLFLNVFGFLLPFFFNVCLWVPMEEQTLRQHISVISWSHPFKDFLLLPGKQNFTVQYTNCVNARWTFTVCQILIFLFFYHRWKRWISSNPKNKKKDFKTLSRSNLLDHIINHNCTMSSSK